MCCASGVPAPGTFSPFQLAPATLRALADPGYVDAQAHAERARQVGVSLAQVAPRRRLPPMAQQAKPAAPQRIGFV